MPNIDLVHKGKKNEKRAEFKAARVLDEQYPNWAKSMTPAEAEAHIETQVTDLASVKIVMREMAKVLSINTMAIRWLFRYHHPE